MIIYTPLAAEDIFAGIELGEHLPRSIVNLDRTVEVEWTGQNRGRVVRLLSTDPRDFLDPRWLPGTELVFGFCRHDMIEPV
ncbi:MAG: YlzJ-like family protein [Bacillota bacterium]